jgi:DNA-directed RNA polymerase subunit RPC12/RpoP
MELRLLFLEISKYKSVILQLRNMEKCPECGSKNVYFDEKYAEYLCKDCLRIIHLEDIIH